MATTQHIYEGEGNPNGVITDAALGSHYIDMAEGYAYQVTAPANDPHPCYWARLSFADPVAVDAFASEELRVYAVEQEFIVPDATTLVFDRDEFGELWTSQPVTVEQGAWHLATDGPVLLVLRRTQTDGWLAEVSPLHLAPHPV
ncbi:hypothetical protein DN820_01745 [Stutzerimonas nosocomialis]|uniref:Uncharacterized protein n=1 Tax=Stutzerimonas nosocomialis TaxID=1056496 RepID=A0A5R9QJB9_9GAMM|nr:hypothetical protein [Stutzerimonas nosocomialis]TLX65062.1 hypothetical protein DN820_01745 [Stutzerimonas nosocomialis]